MGIPALWKVLRPAAQSRTLTQITVSEGFKTQRNEVGTISLGLDASLLLNRAQWAAYHQRNQGISMQAGENLPLQILFWQVCRLLALPISTIFVFDGPGRPSIKRGETVKTAPHALMRPFRELIRHAGFHSYIAPGEAEAELAKLNLIGEIDAVVTDDIDTFLFGATHILRTSNIVQDGDYVSIYTSTAIYDHPSIQLTRAHFLLIAVLSGGDYSNGIPGCGIATAHRLSTNTMLADELFAATVNLTHTELLVFLQGWRTALKRQLAEDPDRFLGRQLKAVANAIPARFPDIDVLYNYVHPVTSWSADGDGPDISGWRNRELDLPVLAFWCEKYFSWGSNVCIRSLLKPFNLDDALAEHASGHVAGTHNMHSNILAIRRCSLGPGPPSKSPNTWGYNITVEPHTLILTTLSLLTADVRELELSQPPKTFSMWLPAAILKHTLPGMVTRFHATGKGEPNEYIVSPLLSVSPVPHLNESVEEALGHGSGTASDPIIVDDDECPGLFNGDNVMQSSVAAGPSYRARLLLARLDELV
ncbi:DNA repair protein complementing XP-G cells [Hypsizygus marmoreus]|uniref:DNA repair protein complementing XP-G cells n=1 Tax=Hypsizygus marmoreus TaxID=39966 RepID=A0A369JF74_HYPMA|nr:DNA repair protein complementing XP-G cells [Hypsizygus marmoreus]